MKKIFTILFLILLTVSCTKKNEETKTEDTTNNNINQEQKNIPENNNLSKNNNLPENNNLVETAEKTMEEQVADIKMPWEEYWDLAAFIKIDLEDDEKQAIIEILWQRKQRQIEINNIIDKAVEEGEFQEKFEKIKQMRSVCASRILPYVYKNKKEKFLKVCENWNIKLQALYLTKMKQKENMKNTEAKIKEEKENKKNIADKIKEINEKKNEKSLELKKD